MTHDEPVSYTDPETGRRHHLDPLQMANYRALVRQGVHAEDAAVVAYLMDAIDPAQPVIDWSLILLGSQRVGEMLDVSRAWVSAASRMRDRPEWRACLTHKLGERMMLRLWTVGRTEWLRSGAPTA